MCHNNCGCHGHCRCRRHYCSCCCQWVPSYHYCPPAPVWVQPVWPYPVVTTGTQIICNAQARDNALINALAG